MSRFKNLVQSLLVFGIFSCKVSEEPKVVPSVKTNSTSEITSNSVKVWGEVVSEGSSATIERGFVYSKLNPSPSTSDIKVISGLGKGEFTTVLQGLEGSSKYYFKAYALNSVGISYGDAKDFTTLNSLKIPIVTTVQVSDITFNAVKCSGVLVDDGGDKNTERGFVYSTSNNPTILNSKVSASGNSFTVELNNLNENTKYFLRAFATNSVGTSYGSELSFITLKNFNRILKDGLIAYYPFNGGSTDISGNGYHGTTNNVALTTDRNNQSNAAYLFNKSSIDIGGLPLLGNSPVSFTKSVWILAETNQNSICKMPILSKRQAIGDSWVTFGGGGNGTIGVPWNSQAYLFVDKPNYTSGITNSSFSKSKTNDGKWHHLVAVKENNSLKIYFDGVLESSTIDNTPFSSSSNMVIGYQAMWGFECEKFFYGKIDDVGIWKRVLTEEEIQFLFKNTFQP